MSGSIMPRKGRKIVVSSCAGKPCKLDRQCKVQAQSANWWCSLVQNLPLVLIAVSRDFRIRAVNRAVRGADGYNMVGSSLFDYVKPEVHPTIRRTIEGVFETGKPATYDMAGGEFVWHDSPYCETRVIPIRGRRGMMAVALICADITERKMVEDALREGEGKFRLAFENAKDAILWADPETGMIIDCNPSAERLLGSSRDRIIGRHQKYLHPPDKADYYIEQFRRHARNWGAVDDEAVIQTVQGRHIPVHISASVTYIGGKKIMQGIFRDITERKEAERQLKSYSENLERMVKERTKELDMARTKLFHSSQLAAVGRMGAGVAHQLASPINSGLLNVDILMEDFRNADKQLSLLKNIRKAFVNMKGVIDCMLSMAMIRQRGEPSHGNVGINHVLEGVLNMAEMECQKRKIKVERLFDPDLRSVDAVVGELDQVFINLVNNAIDAMGTGGILSVRSAKLPDCLEIRVMDTGSGISPDNLDQVFEPFFTTRMAERGIGLGLSIARDIVSRYNGEINVASRLGEGSTFTVRLPLKR